MEKVKGKREEVRGAGVVPTVSLNFYSDDSMTHGIEFTMPLEKFLEAIRTVADPFYIPDAKYIKSILAHYFAPKGMDVDQLKRHDAAVKANATRKAKKEGGAK